jgi:hypothetical protein
LIPLQVDEKRWPSETQLTNPEKPFWDWGDHAIASLRGKARSAGGHFLINSIIGN